MAIAKDNERVSKSLFLMMYHGAVVPGRGIERALDALELLPHEVVLVVLGDGSPQYLSGLKSLVEDRGLSDRVVFHRAVPRDELESWVAIADVGLVTVEAISKSYYFMLPNKFFENVQAEVPIVASNFPETSKLVSEYGIGLTCNPSDASEIAECVKRLKDDSGLYASCLEGLSRAKQALCWERESGVLRKAYGGIVGKRRLIKLLLNDYDKASRDKREMAVAKELGFDITVIDKGEENRERFVDGVRVIDVPTVKRLKANALNHAASFAQRISLLRSLEYDAISCHDLKALAIGWCAGLCKRPRPALVYDAHEFEVGRTQLNIRVPFRGMFVGLVERLLMKHCVFSIVVNDSIADEMTRIHKLKNRPIVVRSTPRMWIRDDRAVASHRKEICDLLHC